MNRTTIRTTIGLVCTGLLVGGLAVATPLPAGATSTSGAATHGPRYRDYLTPGGIHGESVEVSGVGADQCDQPVQARVGNWICFTTQLGSLRAKARHGLDAPAATTSYCGTNGCYYRYGDFSADFQSYIGVWGWGSTVLGDSSLYFYWALSGAQTTTKPFQYTNTVQTSSVVFTGDLLNTAPRANGSEIPGAFSLYNAGTVPANTTRGWAPNGYKSYDNANYDHSQVGQASWNFTPYPGYWYAYAKSICTHSSTKTIYRFDSPSSLPANYGGGGHHT